MYVLCFDLFHFAHFLSLLAERLNCWVIIRVLLSAISQHLYDACCGTASPLFRPHRSHLTFSERACCLLTDRCFTSSVTCMWKGNLKFCPSLYISFKHLNLNTLISGYFISSKDLSFVVSCKLSKCSYV